MTYLTWYFLNNSSNYMKLIKKKTHYQLHKFKTLVTKRAIVKADILLYIHKICTEYIYITNP